MKKILFLSVASVIFILSCKKGDFNDNIPPDTRISLEAINLSGEDRLNSKVRLTWYGTDKDGYVQGFEISIDNVNWAFTTTQDSTFLFSLAEGQDTTDIDFYVRAIDDDGDMDPNPAYLKVPLKNTAPQASFDNERGPKDTAFCASTFYWTASDPDGNETIDKVLIRFNEGSWTEISKNQNLISFLVDTTISSGSATASIYYGKNKTPESFSIDGVNVGGNNTLYLRSIDLAGAESKIDTSDSFYLKNKTPGVNTLWLNGHSQSIAQEYRSYLNANSIDYDFLNYGINQGELQPVYWDPTFRLILGLFDKLFINAPSSKFPNTVTGQNLILLEYLAPIVQEFQDNGGKSFVTCLFDKSITPEEMLNVAGAFPIEDIERSPSGQVRIYPDSLVYPINDPSLPNLQSSTVQFGLVPIKKAADSQDFYRAEITRIGGWMGDDLVATVRKDQNGNLKQVFFAVELHNYDRNPASLEQLIGDILKNEF